MPDHEKLVIMVTHGPEEPELATIPFVMAGAAVASDVDVVMGFQGDGCRLVQKGVAETVTWAVTAPGSSAVFTVEARLACTSTSLCTTVLKPCFDTVTV